MSDVLAQNRFTTYASRHFSSSGFRSTQGVAFDAPIAVVIPAWNEEGSIGRVIDALPRDYVERVVVADNNSTDYTATVAAKFGATVVPARRQGYGSACLAAMAHLAGLPEDQRPEIVVFVDADFSDHPEQLPMLVDPIIAGEADFVLGSRMLKKQPAGALLPQAIFGNKLACFLMRLFFNKTYTDLGPFRAIGWGAWNRLGCATRISGGRWRCRSRPQGRGCGRGGRGGLPAADRIQQDYRHGVGDNQGGV